MLNNLDKAVTGPWWCLDPGQGGSVGLWPPRRPEAVEGCTLTLDDKKLHKGHCLQARFGLWGGWAGLTP